MKTPLAIFSMPGNRHFSRISGPVTIVDASAVLQYAGFVFAPFDTDRDDTYCIRGDVVDCDLESMVEPPWQKPTRAGIQTSRDDYMDMYERVLEAIVSGKTEKIVLSVRNLDHHPIESVFRFLIEIRQAYPGAFVYAFYIPGQELWIGASPELLLDTAEPVQRTVALAGTLRNGFELELWGEKERMEHRYVEQFVEETIADREYRKEGPHPVQAGPVYHLKSEYIIQMNNSAIPPTDLHPGPALSGYPVPSAIEQITRIEKSPRRYYTGFLGPIRKPGHGQLFVNLRCLEILDSGNMLYAGGGLTKDSDAANEWLEIQDKMSTLRTKILKGQKKV